MSFRTTTLVAICLAAAALAPTAVRASDTTMVEVGPTSEIRQEPGRVWIDTYVPELAGTDLQVSLKAPRRNGQRFVWQKCEFDYTGAGRYSCGFRTGPDQDASRYSGTWAAVARIDGERITSETFRVEQAA
ncbi:MAG: hypothetical protein GEU78_00805 [Actinobacteria bacterium]|nr:hypothetical protein [Actinomycetota bacterium]